MFYTKEVPDYGDLFTVEEFMEMVNFGSITPDDGCGNAVKDNKRTIDDVFVYNEETKKFSLFIPADATHVVWFNK